MKAETGALGFCWGGSASTSWELHLLYKPDGVGITPLSLKHRRHTLRVAHLGHPEKNKSRLQIIKVSSALLAVWPPFFLALSRSTQPEYHIHSSRLQGQSQHVFRVYSSSPGRQLRHCCCFCFLFKEKLIGPISKLMVLCLNIMLFKTTSLLLLKERFLGCLCKNKWRSEVSRKAKLSCLVPGSSTSRALERLLGFLVPVGARGRWIL